MSTAVASGNVLLYQELTFFPPSADDRNASGTAETGVVAVKHPDTLHQQKLKDSFVLIADLCPSNPLKLSLGVGVSALVGAWETSDAVCPTGGWNTM
ncbi:MAG: hypothetical protein WBR56_16300 [Sedimenticolaceae bacterium]